MSLDTSAIQVALSNHEVADHGATEVVPIPEDCLADVKRRYDALTAIDHGGLGLFARLTRILIDRTEAGYTCTTCGASAAKYGEVIDHTDDCRAARVLHVAEDVGGQITKLIQNNHELHVRLGDYPASDVEDGLRG